MLQELKRGSLSCSVLKELPAHQISPNRLSTLPQNYLLIQLTDPPQAGQHLPQAAQQSQQQQQQAQQQLQQAQQRLQQLQQQQQQGGAGSCMAGGTSEDEAAALAAAGYSVTIEAWEGGDGGLGSTLRRYTAMLADFGPVFEPGCAEPLAGGVDAGSGGARGSSSSGSGGDEGGSTAPPSGGLN